jgi:hypothetical protein
LLKVALITINQDSWLFTIDLFSIVRKFVHNNLTPV